MKKHLTAIAALALALVVSGCTTGQGGADSGSPSTETTAPGASTQNSGNGAAECSGVRVVVDYGDLDEASDASGWEDHCIDTDEPVTAIAAFEAAHVELEGVTTSDAFFACRIGGEPAADRTLEFDGETYTSGSCDDFGPIWAWWGLFADTGNGWEFAQEGAETLEVAPGEAVAFAFQFGDTTETRLPQL